ncbi:hypothetical protein LTR53_007614 [Teratosphaeriaceae sp. CCFEE 6253]|nr:hypothetical protein LTR53_007614 [Teratosphaeriaceae sp. CCFEE 6253]
MATNSIERFLAMIGGEVNLPPEASQEDEDKTPTAADQSHGGKNPFDELPSVDEVIEQEEARQEAAKAQLVVEQNHAQRHPTSITASPQAHSLTEPGDVPRMNAGEIALKGIHFSPFLAVAKFCYRFVSEEWRQPLATHFFDANKIYDRPWDIYYIWSEDYDTGKPTTFIPEHQLHALISEINEAFPTANISITERQCEEGLILDFDEFPDSLRPRWLGRSTSRDQYTAMADSVQHPSAPSGEKEGSRSLQAFKDMIDAAVELGKTKSKSKKKANQQGTILRRQEMNKQVLRAQRYLGLLPKPAEELSDMGSLTIAPLDPSSAPQHPFDQDAIFIAFDVEAYERSPKTITEVGVATLDTRDLKNNAPGRNGTDWHKHIRARHFRVVEYKHLINKEFVAGCPDRFEFGDSEFVGRDNLPSVLTSCFHEPFSRKDAPPLAADAVEEKRNLVLLGHDVNQDIQYLNSIGFSVLNRGGLLEALDTAAMMRSYTRDPNATSLGRIL